MLTIKKLSAMPYAQAHIEIDENKNISLFSYVTRVCDITADGWFTCYGLYSQTTKKHISAFVKEYTGCLDFQAVKHLYKEGYSINIHTGEIVEYGNR